MGMFRSPDSLAQNPNNFVGLSTFLRAVLDKLLPHRYIYDDVSSEMWQLGVKERTLNYPGKLAQAVGLSFSFILT